MIEEAATIAVVREGEGGGGGERKNSGSRDSSSNSESNIVGGSGSGSNGGGSGGGDALRTLKKCSYLLYVWLGIASLVQTDAEDSQTLFS